MEEELGYIYKSIGSRHEGVSGVSAGASECIKEIKLVRLITYRWLKHFTHLFDGARPQNSCRSLSMEVTTLHQICNHPRIYMLFRICFGSINLAA